MAQAWLDSPSSTFEPYLRKQSSRSFFVSGQAQQLQVEGTKQISELLTGASRAASLNGERADGCFGGSSDLGRCPNSLSRGRHTPREMRPQPCIASEIESASLTYGLSPSGLRGLSLGSASSLLVSFRVGAGTAGVLLKGHIEIGTGDEVKVVVRRCCKGY